MGSDRSARGDATSAGERDGRQQKVGRVAASRQTAGKADGGRRGGSSRYKAPILFCGLRCTDHILGVACSSSTLTLEGSILPLPPATTTLLLFPLLVRTTKLVAGVSLLRPSFSILFPLLGASFALASAFFASGRADMHTLITTAYDVLAT